MSLLSAFWSFLTDAFALERFLKHLLRHVEVIEKQIARASEDA